MMSPQSASQRYLIVADQPAHLQEALSQLGDDIQVHDTIGPAGAPHTAVVTMSHAQADALALRFHNLKIEPDQPLSLFSQTETVAGRLERNQNGKKP